MADFLGDKESAVEHVKQSNVFKMDEEGSEAASTTTIGLGYGSTGGPRPKPQKFVLDHPAVFEIWETSTGLPVMIGSIDQF